MLFFVCLLVFVAPCELMNCAWDEVCMMINGYYGCACSAYNARPNPDTYGIFFPPNSPNGGRFVPVNGRGAY